MARNDDLLKGLGIGLSAAVLVPVVFSALAPVLRPLARSALRAGVMAYEKGREAFEEFGEIASVKSIMDRDRGRSKGFGFVEMPDDDEAKAAIAALNETEHMGRSLKVNEARPRPERRW